MPDLTLKDLEKVLTGAGFAVLVALWFMFRLEKTLERLTLAVTELAKEVRHSHGGTDTLK